MPKEKMWVLIGDSEEDNVAFVLAEHELRIHDIEDKGNIVFGTHFYQAVPKGVRISHVFKVSVEKEYRPIKAFKETDKPPFLPTCMRCNDTDGVCCGGSK